MRLPENLFQQIQDKFNSIYMDNTELGVMFCWVGKIYLLRNEGKKWNLYEFVGDDYTCLEYFHSASRFTSYVTMDDFTKVLKCGRDYNKAMTNLSNYLWSMES